MKTEDAGACLEECLGILLRVPPSDFPFYTDADPWLDKLNDYLVEKHSVYMVPADRDIQYLRGVLIAVYKNKDGRTNQERTHAVLWKDGKILVDPSAGRWFNVPGEKKLDSFLIIIQYFKH